MKNNLTDRLLANTLEIEALSKGVGNKVVGMMLKARDEITNRLQTMGDDAIVTRIHQMKALQQIDGTLLNLQKSYSKVIGESRLQVMKSEYKSIGTALQFDTEEEVSMSIPVKRLTELANGPVGGKTVDEWTKKQTGNLRNKLNNVFSTAIITGDSVKTVSDRLRNEFGFARKDAMILTRTTLLQTAKQARDVVYEENSDIIDSYTYLATLDSRTCLVCGPDDGRVAKHKTELPQPLRHPQCRCLIRANTDLAMPIKRPSVPEHEKTTTHHKDGSTSSKFRPTKVKMVYGDTTYEDFFKRQKPEWQQKVMGTTKYNEWKSGKYEPFPKYPKHVNDLKSFEASINDPGIAAKIKEINKKINAIKAVHGVNEEVKALRKERAALEKLDKAGGTYVPPKPPTIIVPAAPPKTVAPPTPPPAPPPYEPPTSAAAIKKQIADLTKQINAIKAVHGVTPEVEALRKQRKALEKQLKGLAPVAPPVNTPPVAPAPPVIQVPSAPPLPPGLTPSTSISPVNVKSAEDASNYASKLLGGDVKVNFINYPDESIGAIKANDALNHLHSVMNNHPDVQRILVKSGKLKVIEFIGGTEIPGYPNTNGLYWSYHNKAQFLHAKYNPDILNIGSQHWNVTGNSQQGVISHEVGHAVYYGMGQANQDKWFLDVWNKGGFGNISEYARTSEKEGFSEAFAAFTHKKYVPGTLPKHVEDFMQGLVSKKVQPTIQVPSAPAHTVPTQSTAFEQWKASLNNSEKEVIRNWTGSGYRSLRPAVADISKGLPESDLTNKHGAYTIEQAKRMIKTVEKAPFYQGVTYRGQKVPATLLQEWVTAGEWESDSVYSTSKSKSIAESFSHSFDADKKRVVFRMQMKTGADLGSFSVMGEQEVLLRPKTKFKINGVMDTGSYTLIELEEK